MKIVIQSTKLNRSESVDPDTLITFQDGILGFPSIKRYLIIKNKKDHPFLWLQAAEDPDLAFFVVDPLILKPHYQPNFTPLDLQGLEIDDTKSIRLLSIITVPQDNPLKLSANLTAPLVINHRLRRGKQIVLNDSTYHIREPIIKRETP